MSVVDVVIPIHGREPWLAECLRSLANQTQAPDRVIVVDDRYEQPQRAAALGRELLGGRFELVQSDGVGISAALNTGIRLSDARWVARMDADDRAHPQRLERQLDYLQREPADVVACGSQVRFVSASGRPLGGSDLPCSETVIRAHVRLRTCFVHPSLVLSRQALLETPYRSVVDGAEDLDLLIRLSVRGVVMNLPQTLLDYRVHVTSRNFRNRARQTALQELVFRAAAGRSAGADPLDVDPGLGERFVAWRLSDAGYVRSRTFLTAGRYALLFARGADWRAMATALGWALHSVPLTPSAWGHVARLLRRSPYGFAEERCPFEPLNGPSRRRGADAAS